MVQNLQVSGYSPVRPAGRVGGQAGHGAVASGRSFAEVLETKAGALHLSAHAETRLRSRSIPWSRADQARLSEAANQAAARGARRCLFLMGARAFLVSVPNRTVVTALDTGTADTGVCPTATGLAAHVWTDIDSAMVLPDPEAGDHHGDGAAAAEE